WEVTALERYATPPRAAGSCGLAALEVPHDDPRLLPLADAARFSGSRRPCGSALPGRWLLRRRREPLRGLRPGSGGCGHPGGHGGALGAAPGRVERERRLRRCTGAP